VVDEGLTKKVFYKEDDGSVWINNEDVGLDKKAVLRGDGTSIYITQDLGTAIKRQEKFGFNRLIYVVGSEQIYHFKTLFEILKKLGNKWANDCFHLSYGMVNLPEGKMKSREGKVVDADNLMELLFDMAKDAINEKQKELSDAEKAEIAKKVSLSALKYYLLNFSTIKDVMFIPEKSISFDGNTGPYLQYTTARINSLLLKAGNYSQTNISESDYNFNSDEWNVISYLLDFTDSITKSCENYAPVEICTYLYELAKLYNKFYHDNQILNQEEKVRNIRLLISQATLITLKNGLNLLGIEPLERM
ncbi:MAG: arginine--tRNA ligase, partial [Spirochaetes bacterium GWB1_27_13]